MSNLPNAVEMSFSPNPRTRARASATRPALDCSPYFYVNNLPNTVVVDVVVVETSVSAAATRARASAASAPAARGARTCRIALTLPASHAHT